MIRSSNVSRIFDEYLAGEKLASTQELSKPNMEIVDRFLKNKGVKFSKQAKTAPSVTLTPLGKGETFVVEGAGVEILPQLKQAGVTKAWAGADGRVRVDKSQAAAARKALGALRDFRPFYRKQDAQVQAANEQILFRRAYHGTPHKVDRFMLTKIGTGEGAQAYGWGLYFAGSKGTAKWYRDKLTDNDPHSGQVAIDGKEMSWTEAIDRFFPDPIENKIYKKMGKRKAEKYHGSYQMFMLQDLMPAIREKMELTKDEYKRVDFPQREGSVYEVEIPEDHELLDWDKPLSEQPEGVKAALKGFIEEHSKKEFTDGPEDSLTLLARDIADSWDAKGYQIYKRLSEALGSPKAASQYLQSTGIPGLRYLDGMSRSKGEGNHNYVIWEEDAIELVDTVTKFRKQDDLGFYSALAETIEADPAKKPKKPSVWINELQAAQKKGQYKQEEAEDAPCWRKPAGRRARWAYTQPAFGSPRGPAAISARIRSTAWPTKRRWPGVSVASTLRSTIAATSSSPSRTSSSDHSPTFWARAVSSFLIRVSILLISSTPAILPRWQPDAVRGLLLQAPYDARPQGRPLLLPHQW